MLQNNEILLSRFGEYLLKRKLTQEKTARFYVMWVRRFLNVPPNPSLSSSERVDGYIESLRADGNWEDWQTEQAARALQIYFGVFLNESQKAATPIARVRSPFELL